MAAVKGGRAKGGTVVSSGWVKGWTFLYALVIISLTMGQGQTQAQIQYDCPSNWLVHSGSCYYFVQRPAKTYQEATLYCQQYHAGLVAVNSPGEHSFLQKWMADHDQESYTEAKGQEWFTSGYRRPDGQLIWESDNSPITLDFFPDERTKNRRQVDPVTDLPKNYIIYKLKMESQSTMTFEWNWQRLMVPRAFVCEIAQTDAWKIYAQKRDFSYGTGIMDPNKWEMGPKFQFHSLDIVFVHISATIIPPVVLECQATGNPPPTYRWFRRNRRSGQMEEVTAATDARFTITNGRLQISNPSETTDNTKYHCEAENKFGKVLGNSIDVTYGHISEFSNVPNSRVEALLYQGQAIACKPTKYAPDVSFNWFRGHPQRTVRPSLNPHFFISRSGYLYISEVQQSDEDDYRCSVFLKPKQGQKLTTWQSGSKLSMPNELFVKGQSPTMYGPDIQDAFPKVFPTTPMINRTILIECLAYGRTPMEYNWTRDDAPMNPKVKFSDFNRVMTIEQPRLEDTGIYTCHVRGKSGVKSKSTLLALQAVPQFPYPLRDQHVDAGSRLVWVCNALAEPRPTYRWYKNGEVLTSDPDSRIEVVGNILTIDQVEAALHDGMYQCEATNIHGLARSSGQLRALSFPPTFEYSPVEKTKQASVGGNVTIPCQPQGSPRPVVTWTKDGSAVGTVLPNGALHLSDLTVSASGLYTCTATNDQGSVDSSCQLTVVEGAVFINKPIDDEVIENGTITLQCRASFDATKSDVVYSWKFNDHLIDFGRTSRDSFVYKMPYQQEDVAGQEELAGMLYIRGAKFEHEGYYTCVVSTVTGHISSRGYIKVLGPPGEPLGVLASNISREHQGSVEVWWQPGAFRGFPTTKYYIEARSTFDPPDAWFRVAEDIPDADTVQDSSNRAGWRVYQIPEGILSPGTSYTFRVYAGNNEIGYGPPSQESPIVKMYDAPPIFAPENVGGGGGSVGMLHFEWNRLPRSYWGSSWVKYRVFYRRFEERNINQGVWQVPEPTENNYFNTVLAKELYYTPYEVKVQAFNNLGPGVNSSVRIVYSAEEMPGIQPMSISTEAINGTAGYVYWELASHARKDIKGSIFAFQVNYWNEGDTRCPGKYESSALFTRFYGDVTEGLLVGMVFGDDYCVNVQFLNRAGLGPKTDNYYLGMNDAPPSNYPEYVTVMSHGNDSVRVLWRGISTIFGEDPLIGYKAWFWDIREDIRSAKVEDFGRSTTGVIHGVEKNMIYKLRVLGYSNGGDGHKSSDVYFTLGGQIVFDPTTTVIRNSAPLPHKPVLLQAFLLVVSMCWTLYSRML